MEEIKIQQPEVREENQTQVEKNIDGEKALQNVIRKTPEEVLAKKDQNEKNSKEKVGGILKDIQKFFGADVDSRFNNRVKQERIDRKMKPNDETRLEKRLKEEEAEGRGELFKKAIAKGMDPRWNNEKGIYEDLTTLGEYK